MVTQIDRPPTLGAVVVDAVRHAILRGEICPGEPLRELDLSEQMAVSRGTVREALRELQDDGLVQIIPHRGAFVRELSPRTARELYTLRALLEPRAVRLAVENGAYSDEDLEALRILALRVDELEKQANATYETVKADMAFHQLMCSRCNHQLLLDSLRGLRSITWLFVFNTKLYQSDAYSDEPPHLEVFEAIASGDPDRAAETLRDHIRAAGVALLARMESLNLGPSES
jgi:DNA-binding GntR family transcriptional regulator